jgi:plasmid stabilization system protein ParE
MSGRLIIKPSAEADIAGIKAWYDEQEPGLGDLFLERLNRTFDLIRRMPAIYGIVRRGYRIAPVSPTEYVVLYRNYRQAVRVVAVYHGRRDDASFFDRI